MAELEGGAGVCAFASGMAAVTAVMSLFGSGDLVIASDDLIQDIDRAATQDIYLN